MKRLPFILALGLLVGCGYDYDTFADDMVTTMCDKMDECGMFNDYFTMDDCTGANATDDTATTTFECADYDSTAAQDCVDAWAAIECDTLTGGDTSSTDVCNDVCSNY